MGNSPFPRTTELSNLRLIASDKSWIEGPALDQLEATARLDDVRLSVGFPDLHPGKGFPVGATVITRDLLYPALAGNDIGCAMSLFATDLPRKKLKLDRWASRLDGLDRPWDGDTGLWRERHGVEASGHDRALGTIGGGNHFAELQIISEVRDAERLRDLGLEKERAVLLIHSGSRGLGNEVLREHTATHGGAPVRAESEAAERYLARHDLALRFSVASRALIAHRFAEQIGAEVRLVADVPHNLITRETWQGAPAFVHRKGTATARVAALVIPGSRGTPSFLVRPTGDLEAAGWSLAHGAGRRWQRGYAKPRLSHRYRVEDLVRTDLGGRVICEDRELLYDEAPQAYKDIERVIADLEAAGLVAVIAVLAPQLTYKVRRPSDDRD